MPSELLRQSKGTLTFLGDPAPSVGCGIIVWIVQQPSPPFCSNLDLEYIVFSLQSIVVQIPYLNNPEGVEVSPVGNFDYSLFFQMTINSKSGNVLAF